MGSAKKWTKLKVSISAKPTLERAYGSPCEEEVLCGADRVCVEAGGGGSAGGGAVGRWGSASRRFYRWKSKYVGLEVDQVRQLKQLRDENTRLKQLVAELTLDKTMLQDVIRKF